MTMPQFSVPLRAVLFDMGGVLTIDPFVGMVTYADELGIPSDHIATAVRESPEFHEVETGRLSFRDFLKWLCADIEARFRVQVDIRRLAACLESGQQVSPEMPPVLAQLHRAGLRLAVLTNNAREARSWWASGVLPLELFEAVYDSSEFGVRKPNPEVYRMALDRLGLRGAEVVFVDDLQANVDGALKAGLRGLLFTDPGQCRAELFEMLAHSDSLAHTAQN